jgi:hypothetical protein
MDITLIVGIIGGICTIAAAIITPLVQTYFETRIFFPISNDRRKILQGIWKGTVNQNLSDGTFKTFTVDLDLNIKGKKIQGTGIINAEELFYVSLDGSFRNDRFLKMDYQNKNLKILQFGSFVFHLSDDSRELVGKFVGYGHLSKAIIYGSCQFNKN